jgi:hypothetical protein
MRLTYEEMRDWSPMSGKEEFQSAQLRLVCKDEAEFYVAWERIKHINGIIWSGCPAVERNSYSDLVVSINKGRNSTIKDVKEDIAYLRKEIEIALRIGSMSKRN